MICVASTQSPFIGSSTLGFEVWKRFETLFGTTNQADDFDPRAPCDPLRKKGSNMERLKTMPMHPGESEGGYIYIYKFASLEGSERAPFWTCSFWGSEAGLKPSRSPIWAFNPDWRERGPLGWTLPNIWVCGKKMETMYPRWQYGNKRSRPLQATKFIPPIWMIRC